jgi:hypothetical protein
MQLTALSRKSAIVAMILVAVMLVTALCRRVFSPFQMEVGEGVDSDTLLNIIIAGAIFFGCAVINGKSHMRSGLTNGFSALSMPLFGLLSCGIFVASNILIAAISSLCLAVAVFLLLRSLRSSEEKDSIFFAAMLLGIMGMLYPPAIVFVVMLPLLVFILVLSVKQIVMLVVAYFMPFLATSYVKWYMGYDFVSVADGIFTGLKSYHIAIAELPYGAIAIASAVLILLIWGVIHSFFRGNKMVRIARDRRAMHLFIWMTVIALTMFAIPGCDLTAFAVVAVPLSILLAFVLGMLPETPSTIAYWVLIALFVLHLFMA